MYNIDISLFLALFNFKNRNNEIPFIVIQVLVPIFTFQLKFLNDYAEKTRTLFTRI